MPSPAAVLAVPWGHSWWHAWRGTHAAPLLVLACTWALLEVWLQTQALMFRDDGVWAGHLNIWSDWPMHLAMAGGFAERAPADWFAHHPMFAYGELHYPFAVNLISGLLMRLGVAMDAAMTAPTLLAGLSTPFLLYLVFWQVLAKRWPAVLAVFLFFLGSGLGGLPYLWEGLSDRNWDGLLYPATEVSRINDYDWYSGNALTGMLVPQRAFVLGFPWALGSLALLLASLSGDGRRRLAWAGGVLAGLLPLVHVHSYIALAAIGAAVALFHPGSWRLLLAYALPAAVLGGTLSLIFLSNESTQHFRWAPGFSADGGWQAWVVMWWRLWGLSLPLALLSLPLLLSAGRPMKALILGGLLLFAFANLVMVQPNRWDNSKIFLWTWMCLSPLWALAMAHLWHKAWYLRCLVPPMLLALCLTGVLELLRLANVPRGQHMIADASALELALEVRRETVADAVFATNTSHNHAIMAFGARPILLGFTGWMANLGYEYREREADLEALYRGGRRAFAVIQKYQIDYVTIGRGETWRYKGLDESWFMAHFPVAFENSSTRIYATGGQGDAGEGPSVSPQFVR